MSEKYLILQTIYELVRKEEYPESLMVNPREIILRLNIDWDIIVTHLHELKTDGLLDMVQLNIAQISITGKGLAQATAMTMIAAA